MMNIQQIVPAQDFQVSQRSPSLGTGRRSQNRNTDRPSNKRKSQGGTAVDFIKEDPHKENYQSD